MKRPLLLASVLCIITAGCQQPGKTLVAFSRLSADRWQIWTMRDDGSNPRQLTNSPSDKRYPAWSRDGQRLFFRDANNRAFVFDIATRRERQILEGFGRVGSISECPAGDRLLVSRIRAGVMDSSDLWLVSIDGQSRTMLTRDPGLQYDPTCSPDGKVIVYVSGHGYQTHEMCMIDSQGIDKRSLTNNKARELLPAFSPDGRTIAYVSDVTGNYDIWLMDSDGRNEVRVTDHSGIDTRPCWSPDGRRIMFVSDRSGQLQLWVMNRDGSKARQLTKGAPSMDPAWRHCKDADHP